jgi:acid phosphatase (class A)
MKRFNVYLRFLNSTQEADIAINLHQKVLTSYKFRAFPYEIWAREYPFLKSITKNVIPILFLLFQNMFFCSGQTSPIITSKFHNLKPENNHYQRLASISNKGHNASIDTIKFPLNEFRRSAYLKLNTVYLQVPVSFFKIKNYPANSSDQTKAEIDFLLELQDKRTAEEMSISDAMAEVYHDPFTNNPTNEDYDRNISSLFYIGKDLGFWFNYHNLPETKSVLENIIQDATYYFFSLKSNFARPRPYHLSKEIKNPDAPGHAAYPSGHASASYIHAYLLSEIFPQLHDTFISNAYDMAFSREVRGVHYPSDNDAGKAFASQFVKQLLKEKAFKKDYEKMKLELKKAYLLHEK